MKTRLFPFLTSLTTVLLLTSVLAACGAGNKTTQPTTPATIASGSIVILSNFAFSPATLTVAVGSTVTWTNKDASSHTVTSDTEVFNSGGMSQNATFSYTFNTAGTYAYHCIIHTYMKGTIIVQ
jgi:plastocyanin